MLVPGILGFHCVLVISLLVFCLVLRQKWRNALERKAEVTKLMALAAEESLVEEFKAANQYNSIQRLYQCALCYSPTATRCSRCKAVRYCSRKCQIVHWRQGHKDECCSPRTPVPLREGSDFFAVAASPKQFEKCGNDSEMECKFEVSSKVSSLVDDNVNLRPQADIGRTDAVSASPSISSVAGFTSSKARSALLVDVSSNEALGSSTIDRSERSIHGAVTSDMCGPKNRIKKTQQTMAPSSESTNSAVDVDGTSHLDKVRLSRNDEEANFRPQLPNGKTTMSDDVQPAKLGDEKSIGEATSALKDSEDDSHRSKVKNSRYLSPNAPRTYSAIGRHSLTNSNSVLPAKISSIPSLPQNACHGLKTSMQKVVQHFRVSKPLKSYLLGSENEVAGKYNDKIIFPYDLFKKLYTCDEVKLSPFGLINCGNSCYANAVLQCLAFTQPLTSYLVQALHSRSCQKKDWCFICEFEDLILKAREGSSPVSPIGILSKIQKIGSHLGHGREEDAHEFLRCAVDTMQSVCLKGFGAKGKLAEETTLIGLTFGGYLRSKIKCLKCLGKSEQYERMMDLTVEIDGDIGTLEDALQQFTTSETLVGDNKYRCSRCKSYQKAKKKMTVFEEPNILTIVLKRFESRNFGKLNKSVRFPEILNLAPYMSGSCDGSPIYSLYAVVVHLDVMNATFSGHYVCYVNNSHGDWFRIDDSTVMPVELERVLLEKAYMLLYARRSPRPPALIRNNVVSHGGKSRKKILEALPSGVNLSKLKSNSNIPSADSKAQQKLGTSSNQLFDSDEWRFHSGQRIPAVDSSSESSSIFSWSDASSCSTASSKESSRSEDLSDFIFGDGHSWYKSYVIPSDSVASSSYQNFNMDSEENDSCRHRWREGFIRDSNPSSLYTDSRKHYKNLSHHYVSSSSSSSSRRDIDSEQVMWANPHDVRLRRASGESRSAQTFY